MKQGLVHGLTTNQKQSAEQLAMRPSPAFVVGCAASIAILIALMIFPRVGRAETDVDRGKELFENRCTGCHSLDQDKEGPRLRGVYGRNAGTVSTFKYSAALKSSQVTWNDATLDKWLTNPDSLIADNDMAFRVIKTEERAEVIRFLKAVSLK
jgi:cytochrome c